MFDKLRARLSVLIRRRLEGRDRVLSPREIADANFYQFKKSTADFFLRKFGHTRVKVAQTPHYAFAAALAAGPAESAHAAEEFYREYLEASWTAAEPGAIDDRIRCFRESFSHFQRHGFRKPPVITSLPTDPAPYLVDGNHRFAFAAALQRQLTVRAWPVDLAFLVYSRVPGFYGTDNLNMPYQTVSLHGAELVSGRRDDIGKRLAMVPSDAIAGRSILDVACNVGMSALQSKALGATSCQGLDVSKDLVDLAVRFAAISQVYPTVTFSAFNVDEDRLSRDQVFDTAFMFSVIAHLRNPSRLADIARNHVRRFVVFESHPGGTHSDYANFFRDGGFATVTELGTLDTSRFDRDGRRVLWLCVKRQ